MPKKKVNMADLLAAEVHLQAAKPDGQLGGYPAWHGWALREAFLAGARYAKGLQKSKS